MTFASTDFSQPFENLQNYFICAENVQTFSYHSLGNAVEPPLCSK
jgi:hypothetical protein